MILGGTSVGTSNASSANSASSDQPANTTTSTVSDNTLEIPEGMARWEVQEEQAGVNPAFEAMNTINAIRQQAGLSPLVQNKLLSKAAQDHADFIAENFDLYFKEGLSVYVEPSGAPGSTGETPMDRMNTAGYEGVYVAELIAFKHSPTAAVYSWLETLYQRVRILNSNVSEMGHGSVVLEDYTLQIVELGRHE